MCWTWITLKIFQSFYDLLASMQKSQNIPLLFLKMGFHWRMMGVISIQFWSWYLMFIVVLIVMKQYMGKKNLNHIYVMALYMEIKVLNLIGLFHKQVHFILKWILQNLLLTFVGNFSRNKYACTLALLVKIPNCMLKRTVTIANRGLAWDCLYSFDQQITGRACSILY